VSVSPPALASSEGDFITFVTFCVAGTRDPTGDLTVDLASQSGQSSVLSPITLTPANWAYPRQTWVRPVDDTVPEPIHIDSIQFSLTSIDPAFNGVSPQRLVHTITDNDPGADLTVAHAGGPTVVNVNQQFEGLFRVTNNSAVASSGATFTIAPMAGIDHVSNATSVSCTPATGVLTCTVGAIPAGNFVDFTVLFRATTAGAQVNTLAIMGNEIDPAPANDSAVWNLTVN
jgi:hypothetical protein